MHPVGRGDVGHIMAATYDGQVAMAASTSMKYKYLQRRIENHTMVAQRTADLFAR